MRSQARVRELLDYDPETGEFSWRCKRAPKFKAGDVAGSFDAYGYRRVKVDDRVYLSHRLAWLYVYGVWPENQIDHINGIRDDNRIANLREATNAQNRQNTKRADSDSRTGLLGVTPQGKRFAALIGLHGKSHYLGAFDSAEEAHLAYLAAKAKMHPYQTLVGA